MNKQRRNKVEKALARIAEAHAVMQQAADEIAEVRDEEQEIYDNLSEGARNGDQGSNLLAGISSLDEVIDAIAGIDTKDLLDAAGREIDINAAEGLPAKLSKADAEKRRMERLPSWAKDLLRRAESDRDRANKRASEMFSEPGDNKEVFVVADYTSPLKGKVIPAELIEIPGTGLKMRIVQTVVDHEIKLVLEVTAARDLFLLPRSSNMAHLIGGMYE